MKSGKIKLPSNSLEIIDLLKKESEGIFTKEVFEEFEKRAKANDKDVWSAIYQIMRDADSGKLIWALHNKLLSGIFYALSHIGDSQAYRIVINYIKSMDRGIPIGAIELVSGLLPSFSDIDVGELLELANSNDEYKSSFGVIALSKLLVENRLTEEEKLKLESILKNYKNTKHYLDDYVEGTLAYLEDSRTGVSFFETSDLESLISG
ncbi:MAG: hypothetical protein L6Q54_05755 [Leptospiraceae bacterium]|nr:hypothetical protein [Leptospiraceae bacterium]MCK6380741.1 hypothetical protein [Leptospiraceae bacterium]NUM40279.1 hypothetical protein [Leptospiraceae bacterium]